MCLHFLETKHDSVDLRLEQISGCRYDNNLVLQQLALIIGIA